jgi:hypothetical protein
MSWWHHLSEPNLHLVSPWAIINLSLCDRAYYFYLKVISVHYIHTFILYKSLVMITLGPFQYALHEAVDLLPCIKLFLSCIIWSQLISLYMRGIMYQTMQVVCPDDPCLVLVYAETGHFCN